MSLTANDGSFSYQDFMQVCAKKKSIFIQIGFWVHLSLVKAESAISKSAISGVSERKNYRFIYRVKSCSISLQHQFLRSEIPDIAEFDIDDSALSRDR